MFFIFFWSLNSFRTLIFVKLPNSTIYNIFRAKKQGVVEISLTQGNFDHPTNLTINSSNGWKTIIFGLPTTRTTFQTTFCVAIPSNKLRQLFLISVLLLLSGRNYPVVRLQIDCSKYLLKDHFGSGSRSQIISAGIIGKIL